MKNILLITVLLIHSVIFSQSYLIPYIPKVQSPNAYNLGMYGNYPIDPSTGVPRIDIPLYTIKSGKLSFPISISYHASGIKVNQESSTVGLGWVLNAGGMIQRNLRDVPDDKPSNGFLAVGNNIPVYNDIDQPLISGAGIIGNNPTIKSYYNNSANVMEEGPNILHKDTSPDFFNIVTNLGLSGSFCLNNSGQFVSSELNPHKLDIDLLGALMNITDENGNTYRFGKDFKNNLKTEMVYDTKIRIDKSNSGTTYDVQPGFYDSSWQLTAIISADKKDTIQIEYNKYRSKNYFTLASESKTNVIAMDPNHQGGYGKQYLDTEVDAYVISKIKYRDGYVQFLMNDDRLDIHPLSNKSPRISGLVVYDLQNRMIQKVTFENNDYFERPKIADINYLFQEYYKKSLKLNAVKFYDRQNTFVNQYQFGYDYSTPLPARESTYGIDFWGYYNGKNSNTTLLPTVLFDNVVNAGTLTNENRQAEFYFMKSGVLNKIIYPTGGSTTYEYEPNFFLTKEQGSSLEVFDGAAGAYALKSAATCIEFGPEESPHTIKEYNITTQAFGVITFDIMLSGHYSLGQPLTATIEVDGLTKTVTHGPTGSSNIKTETFTFVIHQGSHIKIDLDTKNATGPSPGSPCNSPFISVSGRYKYYAPVPSENIVPKVAGGLRVKKILNMDSNNTVLAKKTYKYGSKQINSIGVGKILTNPFEFENYYKRYTRFNVNATNYTAEMNVISSNPMVEISYSNGSPVFYDKVTEFISDKDQENIKLGKKEYYYEEKGVDRIYTSNTLVPYPRYIYPDWKKTNLVKTITYKNDNNIYFPVNKETYQYSKMNENRIRTLNIFERDTEALSYITSGTTGTPGVTTIGGNPERFYYFNDYVSVGRQSLLNKEVTDYVYGSQKDSLTTKINYQYTNPLHYQITRETTTFPDESVNQKLLSYAHDKNNQKLVMANMIGFPLETTLIKKMNISDSGKIIDKNEVKYENPNDVYPSSVLSYNLQNNASMIDATFDSYDANGNLLQYTTKEGISTVIIWGYKGTQPIAKIENVKLADIQSSLITSIMNASDLDGNAGANNDETTLLNAFKNFRNNLPNYQITTYTYDPMVGVRSITAPSGIREVYLYDTANRLDKVVDANGKVLKEMKYNYKN
ncbi:hypothetical protein [Chryseobacterium sp. Marseille-Q3244]|uniref:hypothetical protein n=1 Tax=Chryseobacterium sp. Marseille-Q3244 TaxID=2758092 RepID=UPI002023C4E3|nr:hypothetical protein [Chryseobacterium sp. Marseille-Q3244]